MRHRADIIIDNLNKKLLLAIQYACNTSGVQVPWDRVGEIVGPEISSGAVIQHLAKVRVKMVAEGLSVPPPLRRGGSGRTTIAPVTPKKHGVTKTPKTKPIKKKAKPQSEESEELEDWKNDDSDFEQPRAKRTKANTKRPNGRIIKKENSHDEDAGDDSNEDRVATGAGFLALEQNRSSPSTAKNTPSPKKSLIIALPSTTGGVEEEDVDMSGDERHAGATGGGDVRGHNVTTLAAAQMEPATGPNNASGYVGGYKSVHHASTQPSSFSAGLYRPNQSLFQQADDDFDFDFSNPGGGLPLDFNSDEYLRKVGITNLEPDGNGTYNASAQQSDFGYQPTNAYHESPTVFGNDHHGHLPLTHWSNDNSLVGSSMATTANQTPAENSAGTDFGGYFTANTQFQPDAFDGEAYDPSADHSMDSLNGGFFPNAFNNEYYGNGSYLD